MEGGAQRKRGGGGKGDGQGGSGGKGLTGEKITHPEGLGEEGRQEEERELEEWQTSSQAFLFTPIPAGGLLVHAWPGHELSTS